MANTTLTKTTTTGTTMTTSHEKVTSRAGSTLASRNQYQLITIDCMFFQGLIVIFGDEG